MQDQCRHCELRGDIEKCAATECSVHENWYAVSLCRLIRELVGCLERDPCPHPIGETETVRECVACGQCGCENKTALDRARQTIVDQGK